MVVTAEALQADVDTAEFLVTGKQGHYLLVVKANQPLLPGSPTLRGTGRSRRPAHYLRDVAFAEDAFQVRTGTDPQVMA